MSTAREPGLPPLQPCYVCQSRTRRVCERCKRPICIEHPVSHVQMHWETWTVAGYRHSTSWTQYLPNGALLKVCPACNAALNAKDAVELVHDRRLARENYLLFAAVLLAFVAIFALPFLLGHFVYH